MNLAKIGSALLALVVAGVLIWHRTAARDLVQDRAERVEQACRVALTPCTSNAKAKAFIEREEERAHQLAWDESYTPAQRRSDPKFDEIKFCKVYFEHLIQAARLENLRDLDQPLRQAEIDAEHAIQALAKS